MQTTLLGLAIALILALVTAIVAPLVVDWNRYREPIEAEASRLTGMTVRINGSIDGRLVPTPMITLHDVVAGAPRTTDAPDAQPLLRAGEIKLELALGALLRGKIEATDAHVIEPEVHVGLDRSGALTLPALAPSSQPENAVDRAVQHRERARRRGGCRVGCAVGAAKILVRRRRGVVRWAVQRPRRGRRRRSTLWLSHLGQSDARRHANQARCRSVRRAADGAVRRHAQVCARRAEFRRRAGDVAAGRRDARQRQARAQRAVARNWRNRDHAVGGQAAEGDVSLRPGRARAEFFRQRRCDARSRAASCRQAHRHGARCRSRAGGARCDRSAAARRDQKFPAGVSVRGEIADAGQDRLERGFARPSAAPRSTRCPAIWISIRAAGRSIIFSCTRRA